jgi:glycosyltransferase involved in cell wall biosynthesis
MLTPEPNEASDPTTAMTCSRIGARDAPKLAVIIACFNYEAYVERAVNSVLNQKCDACELLVVDDGSTDGSWEAISRCAVSAFKIENRGQLGACLFGLDKTQAPFVLFLDADDELKPGSLARLVAELDERVAKLQFGLTLIDAEGNRMGSLSSLKSFRERDRLVNEVLRRGVYKTPPTSGNVFRRDVCELLREVDYDKAVDGVVLFVAPFFGDIVSLSEELGNYRVHGLNDSQLGQLPTASVLDRDIKRFVARTEHLRCILARVAPGRTLIEPQRAYYYRERNFCLQIVSGRSSPASMLPKLLASLGSEPFSIVHKLALAAFFVLGAVLPREPAKALMACRSRNLSQSMAGLLRFVLQR